MNRHLQNPGIAWIYQHPLLYAIVVELLQALNPDSQIDFSALLINYYPVCTMNQSCGKWLN